MTPVKIGSTYYVFWSCVAGYCGLHTTPVRHKTCLHTGDKREAKARIAELEARLGKERARTVLGLQTDLRVDMSLGAFRDLYFASTEYDKAPTTRKTEGYHLASLVRYFGKAFSLSRLTQTELETYRRKRLQQIVPKSWNSELATLKSVFAWGLRREPPLYPTNPFVGVSRAAGPATSQKYITRDNLRKVSGSVTDPYWRSVLMFLYGTYCRGSELRNLRWSDIVWGDKDKLDGYLMFVYPKEKKNKRLPLTGPLRDILKRVKEVRGGSEYVFPNDNNGQLTKDALHHKLRGLGAVVGVKLSPHMLRHTGITDALNSGAPLFSVQAVAGHSQVTTTQNYVHVDADSQKKALSAVETPF